MAYRIQGGYRVPEKIDFRNPQPITNVQVKTFTVEFPDYVPREEAVKEVRRRAEELYERERRLLDKMEQTFLWRNYESF